jgi:hypothetical protein
MLYLDGKALSPDLFANLDEKDKNINSPVSESSDEKYDLQTYNWPSTKITLQRDSVPR